MLIRPTRNALTEALDTPHLALLKAAEDIAASLDVSLWLVGGGTRDLAAGRSLHDLDLAFDGDPADYVTDIASRLPEAIVERTDRFGTASVTLGGARMDLARLRTERYAFPGALPDVRATNQIGADLARRDFTVNAIALGLVGQDADEVVDPFDGLRDLKDRTLRVLHDRSFAEDATRLWRGARTAALFRLEPDTTTARLIEEGARWTEDISGERLWHELAATAARGVALPTLDRLDHWGVLRAAHPGLTLHPDARSALARRRAIPAERLLAVLLAPLPPRIRTGALNRLAISRDVRMAVADTVRLLGAADAALPGIEALEGAHPEARIAARWLDPESQAGLQRSLRRWERTRPQLTAQELVSLGVARGAALGLALRGLRRARYLGTLRTRAEARQWARTVVAGEANWDDVPDRILNVRSR
ncbi:MAG: CCA tRNA nucleotidyltransferase [Chloroflexi bacterium]|nr:CCA tRNA nucleotidyltransferase [Chloroflexota bacterium]